MISSSFNSYDNGYFVNIFLRGNFPSRAYSFFFVWTLILLSILLRASTSPAPLAFALSPFLYYYEAVSPDPAFNPLGGATDRLLALRYGCNYFNRTNTNAILSSLSS